MLTKIYSRWFCEQSGALRFENTRVKVESTLKNEKWFHSFHPGRDAPFHLVLWEVQKGLLRLDLSQLSNAWGESWSRARSGSNPQEPALASGQSTREPTREPSHAMEKWWRSFLLSSIYQNRHKGNLISWLIPLLKCSGSSEKLPLERTSWNIPSLECSRAGWTGFWTIWSSGGCPCPCQVIFKVFLIQTILWFHYTTCFFSQGAAPKTSPKLRVMNVQSTQKFTGSTVWS